VVIPKMKARFYPLSLMGCSPIFKGCSRGTFDYKLDFNSAKQTTFGFDSNLKKKI
jgi:hypothetical protein